MEISTPPAMEEDKEDTVAIASSIHTTYPSEADESELEQVVQDQAKEIKSVNKGNKSRDQKKHGVMSLPAEIRETYAFQCNTN